MFLFLKLCLAHAVADFVLQFEELYQLKLKSRLGHFWHAAIHAGVTLLFALPCLASPMAVLYIVLLSIIHYCQDLIKYTLQARNPKQSFWYFTVDQIIHLAWLATAFLVPAAWRDPLPRDWGALDFFYSANETTFYLTAFFFGTFGGSYFLHNLRKTFLKDSRPDHLITNPEMLHAILERTLIGAIFMAAPSHLFPFTIAAGLLRLPFARLRNRIDFTMSFTYAAALGLLFRTWL